MKYVRRNACHPNIRRNQIMFHLTAEYDNLVSCLSKNHKTTILSHEIINQMVIVVVLSPLVFQLCTVNTLKTLNKAL